MLFVEQLKNGSGARLLGPRSTSALKASGGVVGSSPDLFVAANDGSSGRDSPLGSAFDQLMSGVGFGAVPIADAVISFMSSAEILESAGVGLKCKYQGVLVFGDQTPRGIEEKSSPAKKRNLPEKKVAADFTLLDNTGPVVVTVWGSRGGATLSACSSG